MKTFTPYQKLVVAVLTFVQFTVILDFMILSPLGAILMPAMKISASQFGLVVSVYAFSAGTAGFLAAGFADKYDRKKLLMFFYTGFILGTLFCGLAPNYPFLLVARMVTGLFGGVIGAIGFAIVTDLFDYNMRGRVMGLMQTSFAASQVMGIPIGLYFSNKWGWHAPFIMIVVIGTIVGVIMWRYLKPINEHLKLQSDHSAFTHLLNTVKNPKYLLAYSTTALLSLGGFMIMPFASAFTVNNLGISMDKLPLIYLITGLFAIFIGPLVGRASDAWGKMPVFFIGCLLSSLMAYVYTHLQTTPLIWVIAVNVVMFIGIFSRMIPSQTIMSAIPTAANRGAFMSVGSSVQQVSGGLASLIGGLIVVVTTTGHLEHFDVVGYVIIGANIITLAMMYVINKHVQEKQTPSVPVEPAPAIH